VRLCTIWPGDHPAGLHPGRRGNGSGCASPSAPLALAMSLPQFTRRSDHGPRVTVSNYVWSVRIIA
jgi:hypothetical protein